MKNKKAASFMVVFVIALLLVLIIAGIIYFKSSGMLNKSTSYMTKLQRQTALEECKNLNQNFFFNDVAEKIQDPIYNRDGDDYLDSCDLCVGYGENDGYNMDIDNDGDLIHGHCDLDDSKEHNSLTCKNYLMAYSIQESNLIFTGRCGTDKYCDFLETELYKSGWGNQELHCNDEKVIK